MSGKDSTAAGQRRSQRQRIDLGGAGEGFDRHELELALKASLEEERRREKTVKKRPNSKKKVLSVEEKNTKIIKASSKKLDEKRAEAAKKTEEIKAEKAATKRKVAFTEIQQDKVTRKEISAANKKAEIVEKSEPASKKKRNSVTVEPKKITKKAPASSKSVPKERKPAITKKTPAPFVSQRVSELGRRPAATQASDFITLLACATRVIGGQDQKTDYVC